MNRRQFLVGTTALAAVAAVGAPAFAEQPMTATEVFELDAEFLREFSRNIEQAYNDAWHDLIIYGRAEIKVNQGDTGVVYTWAPVEGAVYG